MKGWVILRLAFSLRVPQVRFHAWVFDFAFFSFAPRRYPTTRPVPIRSIKDPDLVSTVDHYSFNNVILACYLSSCILEYYPRHPQVFRQVPATPLFPSPPLSPLLPIRYSHTYTTATPQLLCHQSVTRHFQHDGGCTPLSPSRLALPPLAAQKPQFPVVDPLWIQALTKCSSRNPFPLLTIHFHGGVYPLPPRRSDVGRSNVPTFPSPIAVGGHWCHNPQRHQISSPSGETSPLPPVSKDTRAEIGNRSTPLPVTIPDSIGVQVVPRSSVLRLDRIVGWLAVPHPIRMHG